MLTSLAKVTRHFFIFLLKITIFYKINFHIVILIYKIIIFKIFVIYKICSKLLYLLRFIKNIKYFTKITNYHKICKKGLHGLYVSKRIIYNKISLAFVPYINKNII